MPKRFRDGELTEGRKPSMSARRDSAALVVASAALVSFVLAVATFMADPQGNITRAFPYLVAEGAVLGAAAWLGWGRRALVMTTACCLALLSASIAVYLLFVEPIPHAECGTLVEELGNAPCRSHARGRSILGAAAAGVAAIAVASALESRRRRY